MNTGSTLRRTHRRVARGMAPTVIAIGLLAACRGTDRPATSEWIDEWNDALELVPTERQFAEGGRRYCDQLLGRLRTQLPALTPAPFESIDAPLDAWSNHFRTLAFECPSDPTVITRRLSQLRDFESEIGAVLP